MRYAGDSNGLSWQNWSRGFSPLFPPFFPLFPPSMAKISPQPAQVCDDTDRPNETWMKPMKRMKHERKANETNETWMKRAITAGVSAAGTGRSSRCRNCDGCFDFHCRFPTSLSCSSWLCKNAQGWPRWPGVAAEFVVVCEARKRLLSARTECEACIQIVSARRGNQNLPSPQELRTSRRICYLWPSTDHWRFLVSKWNVYSITCVCVNRKCLLVCTPAWLLSQLCKSLSLFSYNFMKASKLKLRTQTN